MLGYSHALVDIYNQKVDVARNYLIQQAIESEAKYMLFLGEDTMLPYNGFLKLHEVAKKNPNSIVAGVYYLKLSSPMIVNNPRLKTMVSDEGTQISLTSGKYTAHSNVDLFEYMTNIPIITPLTCKDKEKTDRRWIEHLPKEPEEQ